MLESKNGWFEDFFANFPGGIISNLDEHKNQLHPEVYNALWEIDRMESQYVDYDYLMNHKVDDGSVLRIVTGYRRPGKQRELVKEGVSNAPPYSSYHNWSLAVDLIFRDEGYQNLEKKLVKSGIVAHFRNNGFEWGGNWENLRDYAHFQLPKKVPSDKTKAGTSWWNDFDIIFSNPVPVEWYAEHNSNSVISPTPDFDNGGVFAGITWRFDLILIVLFLYLLLQFFGLFEGVFSK